MSIIAALDKAVRAVCPIDGVSIGNATDRLTWRFVPSPSATQPQKDTAQGVIDAFAYDVAADAAATDQDTLNASLIEDGSIVRALGLVMLAEVNKLRVKTGDPAYTLNQFKAALRAQMRS